MNIENIESLVKQLESLGFNDLGYPLLKRICLKPGKFLLFCKMLIGNDLMHFQLHFEADTNQICHVLRYYDAILQKERPTNDLVINGINISDLEKAMAEINWRSAYDFNVVKPWIINDKLSWSNEQRVYSTIEDLLTLESKDEGKLISLGLKLKYWISHPYEQLVTSITSLKIKSELSQRFYF